MIKGWKNNPDWVRYYEEKKLLRKRVELERIFHKEQLDAQLRLLSKSVYDKPTDPYVTAVEQFYRMP